MCPLGRDEVHWNKCYRPGHVMLKLLHIPQRRKSSLNRAADFHRSYSHCMYVWVLVCTGDWFVFLLALPFYCPFIVSNKCFHLPQSAFRPHMHISTLFKVRGILCSLFQSSPSVSLKCFCSSCPFVCFPVDIIVLQSASFQFGLGHSWFVILLQSVFGWITTFNSATEIPLNQNAAHILYFMPVL